MSPLIRFQTDPQIVHQTIDGEVVIINLESGCYYSLTGTSAETWSLLEQAATIGELVSALGSRYEAAAGEIDAAVTSFVESLEQEGLISPLPDETPAPLIEVGNPSGAKPPFVAPEMQKYTDMQDLLLIDPIHEVGEMGWPVRETT